MREQRQFQISRAEVQTVSLQLETMCVVLDSDNAEVLSAFYEKLLGWMRYNPNDEWTVVDSGRRTNKK